MPLRVAVVTEFYPRAYDPVLGIWAHRHAMATRAAGAEVTVFVLHRLVAPRASFNTDELLRRLRQPRQRVLDGVPTRYIRYVSPPRGRFYASWAAWAAPALRHALRHEGGFDLVHAHNAVPAGDAVRRLNLALPLVVSVHGGDVLWTSHRVPGGERAVRRTLSAAQLVIANSGDIATKAQAHGASRAVVVHLGSDLPPPGPRSSAPLLVTAGHLVARKRHADVIRALARLPEEVRYLIIGDGPERASLEALAHDTGTAGRVEFAGQLDPDQALERARQGWLFVMPSTEEAFGVAYIEAMAAGLPAIAAAGEPGPREIAAAGGGIELVPAGDPETLADRIASLLHDRDRLRALGDEARATVAAHFTWERCGERTLAAYDLALEEHGRPGWRRP